MAHILLIEDEKNLVYLLKKGLEMESYTADAAYDGEEGLKKALDLHYDLIILDLLLPKKDGIDVCTAVRQKKCMTPILMLTARDSIEDRVKGLDSGADEYMGKPFAFEELFARTRSLLRRGGNGKKCCIYHSDSRRNLS